MRPAGYRILIQPDKIQEKTQNGIIIPETTRGKEQFRQQVSTVVSVGEFAYQDYPAPWCKPGDRVLTKEYPGIVVKDPNGGDEEYRLINDTDVLAIL